MTEHHLEADITGGRMDAKRVSHANENELERRIQDFRTSKWTCSCGAGPFSEREACEHLREVKRSDE